MKRRAAFLVTGALLALVTSTPAAAAGQPADTAAAVQAAAEDYLQARAQAVLSNAVPANNGRATPNGDATAAAASAAAPLVRTVAAGSSLAGYQLQVATGKVAFWRSWHERPLAVQCTVTPNDVSVDERGATATVAAHVITMTTLANARGATRQEGEGVDHRLTLTLANGQWRVTADDYLDTEEPGYLEAAKAPQVVVNAAVKRLTDAEDASQLISELNPVPFSALSSTRPLHGYVGPISYNRTAAGSYADRYCLKYNPAYFNYASDGGGDCTPFASQCVRAGNYPYLAHWYYNSTNPYAASPSWYNNNPQQSYLSGRYIDRVSSVTSLEKGDLIYYDWDNDGYLDHTAVYVGIYNGVRCIDAHTTDLYHHAWNLGGSSTARYFYNVRDSVMWPVPNQ